MNENQNDFQKEFNSFSEKIDSLIKQQLEFKTEISELRNEIQLLKKSEIKDVNVSSNANTLVTSPSLQTANSAKAETILEANAKAKAEQILSQIKQQPPKIQVPKPPKVKSDIEKFIGENLANKVGIIITVIGVAIGAKYAIDHDLISPLTRIILGYLVGLGLMGLQLNLKQNMKISVLYC